MDKILIVDDEQGVRESLRFSLNGIYQVIPARNGTEALDMMDSRHPNLVILDIMLPDMGGLDVLKKIREREAGVPVIMLTAVSQAGTAVQAMKLGACEYITKPFDVEDLKITVEKTLRASRLEGHLLLLKEEIGREYPVGEIIYGSRRMSGILDEALKVAGSGSAVLLTGPTGVGKELVARFIHEKSNRKNEPFVPVHCASIPESLFESELFGYEKGAFTNANRSRQGRMEFAGSGTIFLDEVSEIPVSMQVKLLRFLQDGEFSRLGSNDIIKSGARVISASSKDLKKEITEKSFRDDLYYRLSVIPIYIPPLKERREDIIPLVDFYFSLFKKHLECRAEGFSRDALERMSSYDWPGNVRELKNVIERLLVLWGSRKEITAAELPEEFCAGTLCGRAHSSLRESVETFEKAVIREALARTGYNQTNAARDLKTTRRILRYKAARYGLVDDEERKDTGD